MKRNRYKSCLLLFLCLFLMSAVTHATESTVQPVGSMPEDSTLAVTAKETGFDETTGYYICRGAVRLEIDSLVIFADTAKISADRRGVWTQGNTKLIDGDETFTSDALYANLETATAWFFDSRSLLRHPGLSIESDTARYDWKNRIATFDGHVIYIKSAAEKACPHLTYSVDEDTLQEN